MESIATGAEIEAATGPGNTERPWLNVTNVSGAAASFEVVVNPV